MSMITEQVERMRRLADEMEKSTFVHEATHFIAIKVLREAANTIEQLAAKVRAANVERSTAYYNGEWIPVKERLPEEYGEYLITWTTSQTKRPLIAICEYEITSEYDHKYSRFKGEWLLNVNVIAWMPLPLPFKEDKTE